MNKYNTLSKLKSFEKVRDIYIHPEGFSIENGLLTPTMKNKVGSASSNFAFQIFNLLFLFSFSDLP